MFRRFLILALFGWMCAGADTGQDSFYYKDGRSERGQILAEFEKHFLVKTSDGKIMEVVKTDLAKMIKSTGKILKPKEILEGRAGNLPPEKPVTKQEEVPVTIIEVISKPDSAFVSIDSEKKGITPLSEWEIEPGEHVITVSREGFIPQEKKISIKAGQKKALRFKLKPEKKEKNTKKESPEQETETLLEVTTNPDSAQIWIDDKEIGFSPLRQIEIEPGEHVIRICRQGYMDQEDKFAARKGNETKLAYKLKRTKAEKRIEAPLQPAEKAQERIAQDSGSLSDNLPALNGYLSVISKPAGASVFLNETSIGVTPLNSLAPEGPHQVKLTLEGYTNSSYSVKVEAGKTATLKVKLYKADGLPEEESRSSMGLTLLRWGFGAVALAALPACGYYVWQSEADFKVYEDPDTDPSRLGHLHTRIRDRERKALIFGGAGAAAFALFGITFFF